MMIGTVMMTNTIQQQSQQSQHHAGNPTSLNLSKHSHHQSNRDYSATQQKYEAQFAHQQQQQHNYQHQQQPYLSDTDMSEVRSTIAREKKKSRSSNRHQQHDHGTRTGSVVSFDHSTSTTVQSQQQQQSSRHHNRRHQPNPANNSNTKRLTQSSRHNSSRSVNFDANKIQQHQQQPPSNQHDEPYDTVIADNNKKATDEDDNDDGRIQVQILPQDDNWGANTTTYTAATSEVSDYNDDMTEDGRSRKDEYFDQDVDADGRTKFDMCRLCSRYGGFMFAVLIVMCTYVTPILFIVLPRIPAIANWQVSDCGIECEGLLIGIAFKLFLLLLGIWALYLRKPKATMPRVYELRVLILFLLCILTFAYWLFYGVRIIDTRQPDYYKILQFTVTYVDVLLFVYIIAVFILEIRHMQPQYVVRIVRSPDGEQTEYTLGKMSIQRAAVWLLEQYYKDFKVYNPWLDNAHKRRAHLMEGASVKGEIVNEKNPKLKFYDIEGNDLDGKKDQKAKQMMALAQTRGGTSHNERFYEEYEYERRLRKRRTRLLGATEDAFTHIKRIQKDLQYAQTTVMDPFEAAQAVFTSIARDLRRYLRITRQQPYFTRENIVTHLANCISYDMSPRSFLQRYFQSEPLIFNQRALTTTATATLQQPANFTFKTPEQSWILICDTVLYQNIEDNLMLVLKQNDVTLMCTFKRLPHFNLIEDVLDGKRNKFVLKMNSETSV